MKIKRSGINFTTLVLLFAPWGYPPMGVLAGQNVRGKGSGGLFDRPGEDDTSDLDKMGSDGYYLGYLIW